MNSLIRNWAVRLAMLMVVSASAVCGAPASSPTLSKTPEDPPAARSEAPAASRDVAKTSSIESNGPGGPAFTIAYRLTPNKELFYVIEHEFRDSAGIPPLLSVTTWAKCRMTVAQKLQSTVRETPTTNPALRDWPYVVWRCDRFEAQEQLTKSTITYDSLRDSYPPPSLMELAGIANSKTNFFMDPATGKIAELNVVTTTPPIQAARRNLSKTAERCLWNAKTAGELFDDLGPLYFPSGPVKVGDSWSHTLTEVMKTFGTVTTKIHCTLRSVRRREGSDVATIEIAADIKLTPESKPSPPATSNPSANKPKDFRIDRSGYSGTVDFDLTRGMLLQMTLRRELAFVADVSSPNTGPMQIKSGNEHILRVKSSLTAPPRPIIVGGPKPPVVPPEDQERPIHPRPRVSPDRSINPTTRPNLPRPVSTTRPAVHSPRPVTTMPAAHPARPLPPRAPASRPAWSPRPVTTQPSSRSK